MKTVEDWVYAYLNGKEFSDKSQNSIKAQYMLVNGERLGYQSLVEGFTPVVELKEKVDKGEYDFLCSVFTERGSVNEKLIPPYRLKDVVEC